MNKDISIVSAATKYEAAQSEINTRIAVRTNVNTAHMAAIIALTSVFFYAGEHDVHNHARIFIGIIIPLISTYFASYYVHNDSIIGLLSAYCSELERRSQSFTDEQGDYPPSWHSPRVNSKSWIQPSLEVRNFSDLTIKCLSIISPFVAVADNLNGFKVGVLFLFPWCVICSYYNYKLLEQVAQRRKIYTEYVYNKETGEVDFNMPIFFPKTKKFIKRLKKIFPCNNTSK
ncbi:hypothetical protein [Maridesulfovibrio sp.]|uniref:hypothetical protein n=1 Tax=Maridesulfovibrio sp. TaxID=2795000 RepID=UPI002A186D78|nr:hypothetical protein [Maridesulfovibrio sp.]